MNVAIYSRISSDKTGAGLGVERQIEDCEKLAAEHGWLVVARHTDNDVSAYSGKPRPGYDALLTGIKAGEYDAVLCWHQDRLLRRNTDLENYIDACEPRGIPTYTVRAGTVDLATPAGRAVARTLAAWASYEVETSIARVKAAKLQAAKSGRLSGGNRAYGWEQNGMEFEPAERHVLLEMASRVIHGESYRTIAFNLNERGIRTAKGHLWKAINVRNVLMNKHHLAIRTHNGQEYPAQWPRMFDESTELQLYMAMAQSRTLYTQRGPMRKHLLSGFVYCECGNKMLLAGREAKVTRYVCRKIDHAGRATGCGKVSRTKDPLEFLVVESVLYRLETPTLEAEIARHRQAGEDHSDLSRLMAEQQAQQLRLQEIQDDYGTTKIDKVEYTAFKSAATTRLEALGREIAAKTTEQTFAGLPAGQSVRAWWETADIGQRRHVLSLLVDRIVVLPSPGASQMPNRERWHGFRFRPRDVEIRWLR